MMLFCYAVSISCLKSLSCLCAVFPYVIMDCYNASAMLCYSFHLNPEHVLGYTYPNGIQLNLNWPQWVWNVVNNSEGSSRLIEINTFLHPFYWYVLLWPSFEQFLWGLGIIVSSNDCIVYIPEIWSNVECATCLLWVCQWGYSGSGVTGAANYS